VRDEQTFPVGYRDAGPPAHPQGDGGGSLRPSRIVTLGKWIHKRDNLQRSGKGWPLGEKALGGPEKFVWGFLDGIIRGRAVS